MEMVRENPASAVAMEEQEAETPSKPELPSDTSSPAAGDMPKIDATRVCI